MGRPLIEVSGFFCVSSRPSLSAIGPSLLVFAYPKYRMHLLPLQRFSPVSKQHAYDEVFFSATWKHHSLVLHCLQESCFMPDTTTDLRIRLLRLIHPLMLVMILFAFTLTIAPLSFPSPNRHAYLLLLLVLLLLLILAMIARHRNHYLLSASFTLGLGLVGTWSSVLINLNAGTPDFFPLCYVTITIIISSLFLPALFTILLSATQIILLAVLVAANETLLQQNWPSFFFFVILVAFLSMIANYLIKIQMFQLKESAIRDHLTGLFNRRYFDETLSNKLKREQKGGEPWGIILLDIDHFKHFNDQYGHDAGDFVLTRLAHEMLSCFNLSATICRYGGDEFAILLPYLQQQELGTLCENLVERVHALDLPYAGKSLGSMSISVGYVRYTEQLSSAELFLKQADSYLYHAKQTGRNQAVGAS
ncbi:MAG: GGDEF domain-containing protein [Spirochaetia bacterium]|nr:GGDEF domain-containing protein [Spirochaetia bacterium]